MYSVHEWGARECEYSHPVSLFAVFDGHGGQRAAKFASARVPVLTLSALRSGTSLRCALEFAFLATDGELAASATTPVNVGSPTISRVLSLKGGLALKERCNSITTTSDGGSNSPYENGKSRETPNSSNLASPVESILRTSSGSSFAAVALGSEGDGVHGRVGDHVRRVESFAGTRVVLPACAASAEGSLCATPRSSSSVGSANCGAGGGGPVVKRIKSRADEQISSKAVRAGGGGVCGTTATVLALAGRRMTVAHVGDSRAVLCGANGSVTRLCEDHRPGRKDEMERIEAAGGLVVKARGTYRVNGVLAVSRALGDAELKELVIAMPEVRCVELRGEEEFVIIASDGLWDVVSDEECVAAARQHMQGVGTEGEEEAARVLIETAWDRGSTDDVCVLVVNLRKHLGAGCETMTQRRRSRKAW